MNALVDPNYNGGCVPCGCEPPGSVLRALIALTPAALTFAQPGRSYRVTCEWPGASFVPFADSASVSPSKTSEWMRDDSLCGPNQIGWTVYIPSNTGTAYTPVSLNISGFAKGDWSDSTNLFPVCTYSVSAPIP